ncbi:MAG TPA: ABC transporter permease [Acidimicrobiia bacterium]|jgi:spermidine/putrescine transport system permease protein
MPSNLQAAETEAVGNRGWRAMALPGLLWLVLLFLVPFYSILAIAMGRLDPIFLRPQPVWNPLEWDFGPMLEVLTSLVGGQTGAIALRTIVYVVCASALCVLIGYPVAYFVARRVEKRKGLWLAALLAPFWVNYLMRMLAWVNLLANDGLVNRTLSALGLAPQGWLEGRPSTVILGLTYGYLPFFILPLYASLDRIDRQVLEAARDLGASARQTFFRVTMPLSRQGVLAGLVIVMLPMFGDYYTPNLLSGSPRTRMIGNQIDQFINQTTSQGRQGAALTLVLMAGVALLMLYYLRNVARVTAEARE